MRERGRMKEGGTDIKRHKDRTESDIRRDVNLRPESTNLQRHTRDVVRLFGLMRRSTHGPSGAHHLAWSSSFILQLSEITEKTCLV